MKKKLKEIKQSINYGYAVGSEFYRKSYDCPDCSILKNCSIDTANYEDKSMVAERCIAEFYKQIMLDEAINRFNKELNEFTKEVAIENFKQRLSALVQDCIILQEECEEQEDAGK